MVKRAKQRKMRLKLQGGEELLALLAATGEAAENVLDQAAKAGAQVTLRAARARCPVQSGRLRESLHLKESKTKKPAQRRAYQVSHGKEEYYGVFVELGTSKMSPRPFLRPAVDEEKRGIAQAINQAVLQALGRVK